MASTTTSAPSAPLPPAAIASRATAVLRSLPLSRPLDGELVTFLAGMLADDASLLRDALACAAAVGPFLDSGGGPLVGSAAAESAAAPASAVDDESGAAAGAALWRALEAAGLACAAAAAAPPADAASALRAAAGLGASQGSAASEPPAAGLSSRVSLGAGGGGPSATLDLLWGKATNAFLAQNTAIPDDPKLARLIAKKAARLARMDESRARAAAGAGARAVETAAAADAAAGRVSAGAVSYCVVAERKAGQDVHVAGFDMGYGGELLLEGADLHIAAGRRYGLVGRNGMGKTTLLRHMARGELAGAGKARFPANLRVLHVEQEVVGDDAGVLATVLAADVERSALLAAEAAVAAGGPGDAGALAARLAAIDAGTAEARAGAVLTGLGFTPDMFAWPTRALSGGWRMRVALASALFLQPDLLLLDEPTNHIDAKSLLWLVEYLCEYPATLVVVSHDRWFLNAVCTDVIHLHGKRLHYYRGDYDTYERARAEKARCDAKAGAAQDLRRAHIQAFIDKFRFNAKRASLVQSRIKAVERMEVLDEVADDPKWRFEFPDPGALAPPVLALDDATFGYAADRPPLLRKACFTVDLGSRVAVVGPNGVGKSTLIKLLLGELEPQAGAVIRNPHLRVACFTQHHVNTLDLGATAVEFLARSFPGATPEAVRAHLGSFGVSGDLALQRMKTLSGGQKSRVAFALLTWKKPHVLLLDEPSNNLDVETIDAVIVALGNFGGAVVLVSHDQHFVESVCDEIFVVSHGAVRKFKGTFKDYRRVAENETAQRVER